MHMIKSSLLFDKHVEITNNDNKINLLDVKVYDNNHRKYCGRSLLLKERELRTTSLIEDCTYERLGNGFQCSVVKDSIRFAQNDEQYLVEVS